MRYRRSRDRYAVVVRSDRTWLLGGSGVVADVPCGALSLKRYDLAARRFTAAT